MASRIVASALLGELADLLGVQRGEVVGAADVEPSSGPQRDRVAERVEERHDAEHHVVAPQVDDLVDGFDVGADVVVGEHRRPWARRWSRR